MTSGPWQNTGTPHHTSERWRGAVGHHSLPISNENLCNSRSSSAYTSWEKLLNVLFSRISIQLRVINYWTWNLLNTTHMLCHWAPELSLWIMGMKERCHELIDSSDVLFSSITIVKLYLFCWGLHKTVNIIRFVWKLMQEWIQHEFVQHEYLRGRVFWCHLLLECSASYFLFQSTQT